MTPLRFAVPNKGRLMEPTIDLLKRSGMVFERGDRALTVPVRNIDVELLFVRTEDVVEMVADGVAEIGIAGNERADALANEGVRGVTRTAVSAG